MSKVSKTSFASICVGNFDGCHLGHQSLLRKCQERSREFGLISKVITFSPHPREYFARLKNPDLIKRKHLFTAKQKAKAFKEFGVDAHIDQQFDAAFSSLSPEEFLKSFLIQELKMKALTIGHDFKFGKNRAGDAEWLQQQQEFHGFSLDQMQKFELQGFTASSTKLRELIGANGDMPHATLLLGRPYLYQATVEHGSKLGAKLGFPTANLSLNEQVLPKTGVYVAHVILKDGPIFCTEKQLIENSHLAVVNVGFKPSSDHKTKEAKAEVHILGDFSKDIYGQELSVYFMAKIRDEKKFSQLEELKSQIGQDIEFAKHLFRLGNLRYS